ncbi:hypothetical protein OTERR_19030 [Oryzomicrobium terrae]|uniref:Polysaccharide lyase n=1 Tax=Oryzomicrobium terrae TaxID=1735038 RepID=A0A5C1E9S0_9RHOO|nr:hypothetical protein [Oryzomicrobium terrae]QEL65379.1 hypothetical protein OTERR_19030 [Oryzomicrobium terrae]
MTPQPLGASRRCGQAPAAGRRLAASALLLAAVTLAFPATAAPKKNQTSGSTTTTTTSPSTSTSTSTSTTTTTTTTSTSTSTTEPYLSTTTSFTATYPYSVLVNGAPVAVSIGGVQRTYDFGGGKPFVNPYTGVPDMATFNLWLPTSGATVLVGSKILSDGYPPRIDRRSGTTVLGTLAGDQPFAGRCRTQMISFAVPSRRKAYWVFDVQMGSTDAGYEWVLTPNGVSPVLIWELKPGDNVAALTVNVDTDPANPGSLMMFFGYRGGTEASTRVGSVSGLPRHQPIHIEMEAYLDERYPSAGGMGYWKVWVGGKQVVNLTGPTLNSLATTPHTSIIGNYLYNDPCPNTLSRYTFWNTARMIVQ